MTTKKFTAAFALTLALACLALAQNTNTSTTRTRTQTPPVTTKPVASATPAPARTQDEIPPPAPPTSARTRNSTRTPAEAASEKAVRAAFDTLVDGITRADVATVMSVYWNSPDLVLFNNNGTVTKSWAQVKTNRESSYPNLQDVKLAVSDVRVRALGADAALVTCLWTQSQTAGGAPETATGRLSLVFRRAGGAWKVVHTHTSPDRPDPSRLLPSERTADEPAATTTTTTKPAPKP